MNYRIKLSVVVRKKLRKLAHSGKFSVETFHEALKYLEVGALPPKYQDHQLQGEFAHLREFHLAFNLLVIYERDENIGLVSIMRMGTHPELFGE